MSKCEKQGHIYMKFDDRSIFCERCGDQKFLSAAVPSWTYYPPVYPYIRWWANGTGTVSIGDTTVSDWNNGQMTFTSLTDGSQSDA